MGVIGTAQELHIDQVAQQQRLAAAQKAGDGKGGNRGDEHHGDSGKDAGERERQDHTTEYSDAVRA